MWPKSQYKLEISTASRGLKNLENHIFVEIKTFLQFFDFLIEKYGV